MDFIAHFLWTYIIFFKIKLFRWALFFSIIPDFASWGIFLILRLITGLPLGKPDLATIPSWIYSLYGFTHSIFMFTLVFGIIWYIRKKIPVFVLPWLLHILIDIPTHQRELLGTPFLWPFSNWLFPGISWATAEFVFVNYCLIILFLFSTIKHQKNMILVIKKKLFRKSIN